MRTEHFEFRGAQMIVHLRSVDTGGSYALIEMHHPPNVGPALHVHPRGPEAFFVLEGEYLFFRGSETIPVTKGQSVAIPPGVAHRYVVGPEGGRALVITPPELELYFARIAERLQSAAVPWEEEFAVAAEFGQEFLDQTAHWTSR